MQVGTCCLLSSDKVLFATVSKANKYELIDSFLYYARPENGRQGSLERQQKNDPCWRTVERTNWQTKTRLNGEVITEHKEKQEQYRQRIPHSTPQNISSIKREINQTFMKIDGYEIRKQYGRAGILRVENEENKETPFIDTMNIDAPQGTTAKFRAPKRKQTKQGVSFLYLRHKKGSRPERAGFYEKRRTNKSK